LVASTTTLVIVPCVAALVRSGQGGGLHNNYKTCKIGNKYCYMTATELLRTSIKKQIDIADEKSLKIIQAVLNINEETDWWDELPTGPRL
jgi:hypothetical protein